MIRLRSGLLPGKCVSKFVRFFGCTALLMLSACASRQAQHSSGPQYAGVRPSVQVAGYVKVTERIELEGDGLEAQTAPPMRLHNEPDNPLEPFSPNYGTVLPASAWADEGGDAAGGSNAGSDAFDPFLDGPQWERDANDVVAQTRLRPTGRAMTVAKATRRRARPGFRAKRGVRN